ncbi:MAG: MerR family transcriptional regulator [Chloroflexota bacterium]
MTTLHDTPSYNLKAVIRQTGLKPDTLRAWERRYGLPEPQRSRGGHRLYSERDIATIKWLIARQREGLSIKRAVELWHQLQDEGQDPLYASSSLITPGQTTQQPVTPGDTLIQLRQAWIAACLAFDEQKAEQALSQAFSLYVPETVCLELLQKGLAQIGQLWYEGQATVQQEHFASALAVRRLWTLILATPPPTRTGRILTACPPGEEHSFPLLLVTLLLRRRGWDVVYLGANVPLEKMIKTIDTANPKLVLLTAQTLSSAANLLEMAHLLNREQVSVAFGGLVFNLLPELVKHVPGHFVGRDLEQTPQTVEQIMAGAFSRPEFEAIPEHYFRARNYFQERQPHIEAHLNETLHLPAVAPAHLEIANKEIALNIKAALTLGNMDYLSLDVDWVKGLLGNYQLAPEPFKDYLAAYLTAAQAQMDERGEPVVAWLARLLKNNPAPE